MTDADLTSLMRRIADGDIDRALADLHAAPGLATARVSKSSKAAPTEFFIDSRHIQVYAGDTALHIAAASQAMGVAEALIEAGADIRARNRRGAEPLHAAVMGGAGTPQWNPDGQVAMIRRLIGWGADVDARALGGVTPLHRAIRNRSSAAVHALLDAGADIDAVNDSGSTPRDLASVNSGRSGSGSDEAHAEQEQILHILAGR